MLRRRNAAAPTATPPISPTNSYILPKTYSSFLPGNAILLRQITKHNENAFSKTYTNVHRIIFSQSISYHTLNWAHDGLIIFGSAIVVVLQTQNYEKGTGSKLELGRP